MPDDRPHARHAAADRARQARRRRTLRTAAIPVAVIVVAVVAALLITSGSGSDEPPAPGSPEQLALGEEVFTESCQTCHGEGLRGGLAGPPLISEIYRPDDHPDSAIRAAVANGVQPHHWEFAGMPPIPGLSETDVDAVIAYIRDVQREAWGGDTP